MRPGEMINLKSLGETRPQKRIYDTNISLMSSDVWGPG